MPEPDAIARHRTRGTEYTYLRVGHGGYADVTTRKGSTYIVRLTNVEVLVAGFVDEPGTVLRG